MLRVYNPWENRWNYFQGKSENKRLVYYARDLMEYLEFDDEQEFKIAVDRAFKACEVLHISIDENFKTIFRYNGNSLVRDLKLSLLGCYLITINANPQNPNIARAQLYFTIKNVKDV
ncbi:MAG: hypothetical protein WBP45_16090 [Daejeonella sp.]